MFLSKAKLIWEECVVQAEMSLLVQLLRTKIQESMKQLHTSKIYVKDYKSTKRHEQY
jgi:hypothetical protein